MENKDRKNQAYQILKDKLVNCEYKPGSVLNETKLAEELGFSRTPIREALGRIENEGYIRVMPKKGIYVTEISLNDVKQIFETRIQIEPVSLRMAAPRLPIDQLKIFREKFLGEEPDVRVGFRLDTAMHLFIIEHCGNRYIIDMMRKVFDDNTRVIISSKQNEVKIHDARREHTEILDLLIAGEYDQAQTAMCEHIEECKRAAMNFFYNYSSYIEGEQSYQLHLERTNA